MERIKDHRPWCRDYISKGEFSDKMIIIMEDNPTLGRSMERSSGLKECPRCGLRNRQGAYQCDFCGWDFKAATDDWMGQVNDLERIGRDVGAVDILVNNAAAAFYMPFTAFSASRLRVASAINFEAPWDLCQRLVPGMRARGRGWILNLTSYAGDMPRGTPPFDAFHQSGGALLYGATKAALNRFTAGLAAELYADNIVVNALAPLQMVITPGVKAMGIDKSSPGVVVEPVEAMAEAALALCTSGVDGLNGRIARSLPLLQELKRPALSLDGRGVVERY